MACSFAWTRVDFGHAPESLVSVWLQILGQGAVHGAFAGFTGSTVGLDNTHYVYLPIPVIIQVSAELAYSCPTSQLFLYIPTAAPVHVSRSVYAAMLVELVMPTLQ